MSREGTGGGTCVPTAGSLLGLSSSAARGSCLHVVISGWLRWSARDCSWHPAGSLAATGGCLRKGGVWWQCWHPASGFGSSAPIFLSQETAVVTTPQALVSPHRALSPLPGSKQKDKGKWLQVAPGWFRSDIRACFFIERAVRGEAAGSPSREVLRGRAGIVLRDTV